jgi:hypothetical protein
MEESGNIAEPSDRVIPFFQASDQEIYTLFREYLQILTEEIRRMPRLSCYYNILLCENIADNLAKTSGQLDFIESERQELLATLKSLSEHADALQVLCPVSISDSSIFCTYSLDEQERKAQRFFEGRDPSWADIATGFGISRHNFRRKIHDCINGVSECMAILINAVAGAGKSTEIMRLGLQLSQDPHFVVYQTRNLGADSGRLFSDVDKIINASSNRTPIVVVDGAAATLEIWRVVAREFRTKPIIWLLCDRTERWVDAIGRPLRKITPNDFGVDELVSVPLQPLDTKEIDSLINHLQAWKILPESDSKEEWANRFRELYQGQILVTLLEIQAEAGKRQFKEKLVNEALSFANTIGSLGKNAAALRYLYPAVAAIHRFGISPTRKWILNWLKTAGSDDQLSNEEAIQRAIDAEILISGDEDRLQCRHEVIAEVVTQEMLAQPASGKLLFEIYRDWIRCTDTEDRSQTVAILSLFTLPVYRRKLWSVQGRLRLYEELREHFPGDIFVESSAGYCAIKSGRTDLARKWHAETGGRNRAIFQYLAAEATRRGEIAVARSYYHQALGHSADATPEQIISKLRNDLTVDPALLSEWVGFLKNKCHNLDPPQKRG